MKAVLLFLAAVNAFGQGQLLSPSADFDLLQSHKPAHAGRGTRTYFGAAPNGLTLVTIGENEVLLASDDLNGRILHSRSDLASVHAQINGALVRPDGSFWLVSLGPYSLSNGTFAPDFGFTSPVHPITGRASTDNDPYYEMDLYSSLGEHLSSVGLLSPAGGSESPIAAANEQLVLRSTTGRMSAQSQFVHFGSVAGGQFTEQTRVRLAPPVLGAIPLLASAGDLLLIDKKSGSILVIDPTAKSGAIVRPTAPHPVQAAAVDSDRLYLLSDDVARETTLRGEELAVYRLQLRRGFVPASLAVTGRSLFLVDRAGHAERFELN